MQGLEKMVRELINQRRLLRRSQDTMADQQ